jgi:hypothetical protein
MTEPTCPYCSNPNYLAGFTKGRAKKVQVAIPSRRRQERFWADDIPKGQHYFVHVETEQRGEYLRIILEAENFTQRWHDFTVEVFGVESVDEPILARDSERVIADPPAPFFFLTATFRGDGKGFNYQQFFICRVTHKLSNVELIVHWWPTHGRLFNMQGSLSPEETNEDLAVAAEVMEFFRVEARGEPKVTEEGVARAIQSLEDNATQASVAGELGVTARTLRRWADRNGFQDWEDVKQRYQFPEVGGR